MTAAEAFWRKLTGAADSARFTGGDLLAVAVPSSEGWEDRDDIHWFYGFSGAFIDPFPPLPNSPHAHPQQAHPQQAHPPHAMYIRFPTTAGWDAKDLNASLLALIELGQEVCGVKQVWLAVKRNPEELEDLVHTLLYVGFEVDDPPAIVSDDYLFLRLDL